MALKITFEQIVEGVKTNPNIRWQMVNLEPTVLASTFKLTLIEAEVIHAEAKKRLK